MINKAHLKTIKNTKNSIEKLRKELEQFTKKEEAINKKILDYTEIVEKMKLEKSSLLNDSTANNFEDNVFEITKQIAENQLKLETNKQIYNSINLKKQSDYESLEKLEKKLKSEIRCAWGFLADEFKPDEPTLRKVELAIRAQKRKGVAGTPSDYFKVWFNNCNYPENEKILDKRLAELIG